MNKPTKPTADELALAAANKLQIAVGRFGEFWWITTAGNRNHVRISAGQSDRLAERLNRLADLDADEGGDAA